MNDESQLESSALQSLLGGSEVNLIPESLVTLLTVSFVVLNILALLFFVFYVISLVRKWKVQSAVLTMQKDLAEIKDALSKNAHSASPAASRSNNNVPSLSSDD